MGRAGRALGRLIRNAPKNNFEVRARLLDFRRGDGIPGFDYPLSL